VIEARQATVIVPIYNAFEQALRCADSLIKYLPKNTPVLFIDDASTEGTFENSFKQRFGRKKRFSFHRNNDNLGFVASSNIGMKIASPNDVVLLNSDTIVTPRWLTKMKRAAYSSSKVGTVTPLSNNASICSFPNIGLNNKIPNGYSLNQFARLVEHVSESVYLKLPTCVGFCVFIKRELLDKIGLFDESLINRGYGEENDLSLRAQAAGFEDILDESTFIFHEGGASFGKESNILSAENTKILNARHPRYQENLIMFFAALPISKIHHNIFNELVYRWSKSKRANVLHVLHNGPFKEKFHSLGGTEFLLQKFIKATPEFAHWSLIPHHEGFQITAHMPGLDREFLRFFSNSSFDDVINKSFFDIVHLQHTQGFQRTELATAIINHGNYVLSVHDHHLACPRIFMLTPEFKFCNQMECVSSCGYSQEFISEFRSSAQSLIKNAKEVYHFSNLSKKLLLPVNEKNANWKLLPHGTGHISGARPFAISPTHWNKDEPLKILFLGSLLKHKGSDLAAEITETTVLENGTQLEWHILGNSDHELPVHVKQHGVYNRKTLAHKLEQVKPHLALFLSLAPESYNLAVDEAILFGIPVIVPVLGAAKERIEKNQCGWVLEDYSAQAIKNVLNKISSDASN